MSAERNLIFLACRKHKTRRIIFFKWLHFFFSWLFLYHKEVTRVFSSTLNLAWQFSYQWNRRCAILPQSQTCKFGRTKFDTHTVLSRDEVLISLIILLQVLLSPWRSARKVQLCFLRDLAFHLHVAKNFFNNFFMTWGQKEFASVVEFNRKYMKLRKFGILVNKTTSLFTSVGDSNISRGVCENFGNSGREGG